MRPAFGLSGPPGHGYSAASRQFGRRLAPGHRAAQALPRRRGRIASRPRESRSRSMRRRTRCDAAPWISSRRFWAAKAAALYCGWSQQILAEGQRGVGRERRIEADEQRLVVIDALQRVHPVGHGDVVVGVAFALPAQEIPRRPGAPALRHQPGVAMQIDRVGRIADGAENGALAVARRRDSIASA